MSENLIDHYQSLLIIINYHMESTFSTGNLSEWVQQVRIFLLQNPDLKSTNPEAIQDFPGMNFRKAVIKLSFLNHKKYENESDIHLWTREECITRAIECIKQYSPKSDLSEIQTYNWMPFRKNITREALKRLNQSHIQN